MQDSEDNPDPRPTKLDLLKLDDLQDHGVLYSEHGVWSVFRYRNQYTLVFNEAKYKFAMFDFPDLESLTEYLKGLK